MDNIYNRCKLQLSIIAITWSHSSSSMHGHFWWKSLRECIWVWKI